jgi:HK97 family phage major capsid protein
MITETQKPSLKGLHERRVEIEEKIDAIFKVCEKEKRSRTADEHEQYDKLNTELRKVAAQIEDAKILNEEARSRAAGVQSHDAVEYFTGGGNEKETPVFTIYKRTKETGAITDWYQRNHDVKKELVDITAGQLIRAKMSGPKNEIERRAIEETVDADGGYYVPTILSAKIFDNVRAKSHVLSAGTQTVMLDSKSQKIAKLITDPTSSWVAESAAITASDPTFDAVEFSAKKLVSRIDASGEWMQDAMNADQAINFALTGSIANEVDRVALLGASASGEPVGLKNYTNINSYSMGTNGLALSNYDPYLEAIKLLYDDNSETPNTAIMAPRTWLAQSKLKDTTNQPLQLPPALAKMKFLQTSKIPVNETQGTAVNASTIFLGGFENLFMGLRLRLQIIPTMQLVATNYQFSFLAVTRLDFQPFRDEAFAKIIGVIP